MLGRRHRSSALVDQEAREVCDASLPGSRLDGAGAGVLAPLAVALVLAPFRFVVTATTAALVFVVVVVAVAALGNRVAGALAALSATAWFDFFFTQPYHQLAIVSPADVQTAV